MGVLDEENEESGLIAKTITNEKDPNIIPENIVPTLTPTPTLSPTPTSTIPPDFKIDSVKNNEFQILYNVPIEWQKENISPDTIQYFGNQGDFIFRIQKSNDSLEDFSEIYLSQAITNGFVENSRLIQPNNNGELEIISSGKSGRGNRQILITKRDSETFTVF